MSSICLIFCSSNFIFIRFISLVRFLRFVLRLGIILIRDGERERRKSTIIFDIGSVNSNLFRWRNNSTISRKSYFVTHWLLFQLRTLKHSFHRSYINLLLRPSITHAFLSENSKQTHFFFSTTVMNVQGHWTGDIQLISNAFHTHVKLISIHSNNNVWNEMNWNDMKWAEITFEQKKLISNECCDS